MQFSTFTVATLVSMSYFAFTALSVPVPTASAASLNTDGTPLTLIDTAAGTKGAAHVRNYCPFPVYLYVCGQGYDNGGIPACSAIETLPAKTGTYQETYFSVNNGRSIKISPQSGRLAKPILQFEYTDTGTGKVSYDLSEVDGNPFGAYGFTLTSTNAACFQARCAPPATSCPGVFTDPTNGTPHVCPIGDGVGVTLCG